MRPTGGPAAPVPGWRLRTRPPVTPDAAEIPPERRDVRLAGGRRCRPTAGEAAQSKASDSRA